MATCVASTCDFKTAEMNSPSPSAPIRNSWVITPSSSTLPRSGTPKIRMPATAVTTTSNKQKIGRAHVSTPQPHSNPQARQQQGREVSPHHGNLRRQHLRLQNRRDEQSKPQCAHQEQLGHNAQQQHVAAQRHAEDQNACHGSYHHIEQTKDRKSTRLHSTASLQSASATAAGQGSKSPPWQPASPAPATSKPQR